MDRKSLIILAVSFLVIMLWFELVKKWYPPADPSALGTNAVAGATNVAGGVTNTGVPAATNTTAITPPPAAPNTPASPVSSALAHVSVPVVAAREQLEVLDTPDVRYTFTSHGGGLKLVELKRHRESVACFRGEQDTNKFASLNTQAPVPAFALIGNDALQDGAPFKLTRTATGLIAEKQLPSGLVIAKEFTPSSNYLLRATMRLENRGATPLLLPPQEWVFGTATPIDLHDQGLLMGTRWFNGKKTEDVGTGWFANSTLGCFPGTPRPTYTGGASNVSWASVHNQFFSMLAITPTNDAAAEVVSRRVPLPKPAQALLAEDSKIVAEPHGFQTALLFGITTLAPAGASNSLVTREVTLFTGPKEYHLLARLAHQFKNEMDQEMGFGGFFGFFSKGLLLAMNGLNRFGFPYWLCIITITLIIKLLFWPLTAASTRSMKRMQEFQPQIKALQDKYKDDPQQQQRKMMEFWKEHKINPMSGCLPMLVQIPVFIGFYQMLQSAIELRGERFLWACDLSQADTVATVAGFPINPLPIVMAATMLWQARLMPPSPGMDPMQQKIMKYMPLMFVVMLYTFSAGLTLYWTVQNLLTIAQTKYTYAKDAKDKAAAAAAAAAPAQAAPKKKKQ
ncbi:MAG: membrane protein insertase YidC [Verrucomicrobia bacterium]|nr:membrane protein insertase YidC [Verrucomicrobiota bacterium]